MDPIDILKDSATHYHINFEDIEDLRKRWEKEGGEMGNINLLFQQMEFRSTAYAGQSSERGMYEFLTAHSFLVDMFKGVTKEAGEVFGNCIAATLKEIGRLCQDKEAENMRELALKGITNWRPPTRTEVDEGYQRWRNAPQ